MRVHEFVEECGDDVLTAELVEATNAVIKLLRVAHVRVRRAVDEVSLVSIANEWIISQENAIQCASVRFDSVR